MGGCASRRGPCLGVPVAAPVSVVSVTVEETPRVTLALQLWNDAAGLPPAQGVLVRRQLLAAVAGWREMGENSDVT